MKKNFNSSNILPILAIIIMLFFNFVVNHLLFEYYNLIPLIIGCILCVCVMFDKEKLDVEEYFDNDKELNRNIQMSNQYRSKLSISFFSVFLNIFPTLAFNIVKSHLISSLVVVAFALIVVFLSFIITDWISSSFCIYNFTINHVFSSNQNFNQTLWTYLSYRENVINRITDNEPIYTWKYISKENKKEVTFEELEKVKKAIENLSTQQLEKILFNFNSSLFRKQAVKSWRKLFAWSSVIGSVFLFFREDIRSYILEILKDSPKMITMINDTVDKLIPFFRFQGNSTELVMDSSLERTLFYIYFFYVIIIFIVISKEKLERYFNSPRKMTIEKYLIPMIEDELKKKKLQEKKIQIYRINK